jgi:hypothetical protein
MACDDLRLTPFWVQPSQRARPSSVNVPMSFLRPGTNRRTTDVAARRANGPTPNICLPSTVTGWQAPQPPTSCRASPLHPGARDPLLFALPHPLPSSPRNLDRPGPHGSNARTRELPGARRPDDPRQGGDWVRNRCHASGVDASTLAPESLLRLRCVRSRGRTGPVPRICSTRGALDLSTEQFGNDTRRLALARVEDDNVSPRSTRATYRMARHMDHFTRTDMLTGADRSRRRRGRVRGFACCPVAPGRSGSLFR